MYLGGSKIKCPFRIQRPPNRLQLFDATEEQGFGFTSTPHIKDTALIASWQQVAPRLLRQLNKPDMSSLLAELSNTRRQLQTAVNNVDPNLWSTIADIKPETAIQPHQQKHLTAVVRKRYKVEMTNSMSPEDMSVYLSTGGEGAGAWLHAPADEIPPLSNERFAIAAMLRINMAQTPTITQCQRHTDARKCNERVSTQLHHALTCAFGPYRTNRHDAVCDATAKLIRKITGQEPLIEQNVPPHSLPADIKSNNNRSDITWHTATWHTATETIHLDIMITSAFTKAALAGNHVTAITPGYANNLAEQYKRRKYAPHPIVPIVFEAHGRFGTETLSFLRKTYKHPS